MIVLERAIKDSSNTDLYSAWMGMGLRSVFDESTIISVHEHVITSKSVEQNQINVEFSKSINFYVRTEFEVILTNLSAQ